MQCCVFLLYSSGDWKYNKAAAFCCPYAVIRNINLAGAKTALLLFLKDLKALRIYRYIYMYVYIHGRTQPFCFTSGHHFSSGPVADIGSFKTLQWCTCIHDYITRRRRPPRVTCLSIVCKLLWQVFLLLLPNRRNLSSRPDSRFRPFLCTAHTFSSPFAFSRPV